MRALILEDGYSRGALAAARALRRAGWTVGIGAEVAGLAASSRSTARFHPTPPPAAGLDRFIARVAAVVERHRYEVVFGAGDVEVLALSEHRSRIPAAVPYPPHDVVLRAFDKLDLAREAIEAGLRAPRTEVASSEALERTTYPVVVKSRVHGPVAAPSRRRIEAEICHDRRRAAARADEIRAADGEPVLQELVGGELMALTTVRDHGGNTVAALQQRSERIWPVPTGISARAITEDVDPALLKGVEGLLARLGWFGLAEVQFLRPTEGEPCLIDLNGRFYGSMGLATAAGVNLPALWGALVLGWDVDPAPPATVGVRYQWLEGDLRRAARERRGGMANDVLSCIRYGATATHSIWRATDPAPGTRYAGHLALRLFRKVLRPSRSAL